MTDSRKGPRILWRELAGLSWAAWSDRAACRRAEFRGVDFFPDPSNIPGNLAALRVCGVCPVRAACLAAHGGEEFGVFGGLTEVERRRSKRQRRSA